MKGEKLRFDWRSNHDSKEKQFECRLAHDFNYLIGEADVKLASGHAARLNAVAIAALRLPLRGPDSPEAQLNFDGQMYNQVPRALALSGIPSLNDGNSTLLVVNRLGGSLGGSMSPISLGVGCLADDQENISIFSFRGGCQIRELLGSFPRTAPPFSSIIPSGHTGWMYFYSTDPSTRNGEGIIGAAITLNPGGNRAFNSGSNLRVLTLTS